VPPALIAHFSAFPASNKMVLEKKSQNSGKKLKISNLKSGIPSLRTQKIILNCMSAFSEFRIS
jgi:hypothetical protein